MRELPKENNYKQYPGAESYFLAEAVQPIKGGIAPGKAPIAVDADVRVFSGV